MSFSGIFAAGLSGVTAYSQSLEAISSNIANSQTDGFKRSVTSFSDLIPRDAAELSESVGAGSVGQGVTANSSVVTDEQGAISRTGTSTNIAISGQGFFVVSETAAANDSDALFTRAGDFTADSDGNLVNSGGFFLQGVATGTNGEAAVGANLNGLETININRLSANAGDLGDLVEIDITADGVVRGLYAGGESQNLFQVALATFRNPQGLTRGGATTFLNNTNSGEAQLRGPGEEGAGQVESSAIEISTVDIGQEFSTLIQTQRAYSTNARLISVADELLSTLVSTAQ